MEGGKRMIFFLILSYFWGWDNFKRGGGGGCGWRGEGRGGG